MTEPKQITTAGARTQISEEEEKRRGAIIREGLGLKRSREHRDRVDTVWGDKTDLGLFRMMQRIVLEGIPQHYLGIIAIAFVSFAFSAQAQLANISTRGHVGTNQEQIIAGFILEAPATVIIRGLGPTLESFGLFNTLPDPCLSLYNGDRALIAINNDWQRPQVFDEQGNLTVPDFGSFAPRDSRESALKLRLAAGQYTVVLGGFGMCEGIGLVEVYQVAR